MELKAKKLSLIIKIIDVCFMVAMAILKWCGKMQNITINEICIIGGVIAGVFGDISLNTALDKFTKKVENE